MKIQISRGFELHAPTRIAKRVTISFCFGCRLQRLLEKTYNLFYEHLDRNDPHRIRVAVRPFYAAVSNRALEMPRSSNSRISVSSIKLLGQEAPAVMPTTTGPGGNQKWETTSRFSCES